MAKKTPAPDADAPVIAEAPAEPVPFTDTLPNDYQPHVSEAILIGREEGLVAPEDDRQAAAAKVVPIIEALALAEELRCSEKASPNLIRRLVAAKVDLVPRVLEIAEAGDEVSKARAAAYRASHALAPAPEVTPA